jgi:putative addiction module component (TIGR02574 family)
MSVSEATLQALFDLDPSDKLLIIHALWDDLASHPQDIPVHENQIREAERRDENLSKNPKSALSWDEVLEKVRGRDGKN